MQAAYPVMGAPVGPAMYAMAAGYPPGPAQTPTYVQAPAYMQAPYTMPPNPPIPPGYVSAYGGSPYYTYPVGAGVIPEATQRQLSAQPITTVETLQQKVDAKIESIMSAHKTDMLSQQITRLADKVSKLTNHIEYQQCVGDRASLPDVSVGSSGEENEMSKRLRKLAAESSRRASPHF